MELMHECFPKYFRMRTARMKQDEINRGSRQEERRGYEKKYSRHEKMKSDGLSLPNHNTTIINITLTYLEWLQSS